MTENNQEPHGWAFIGRKPDSISDVAVEGHRMGGELND